MFLESIKFALSMKDFRFWRSVEAMGFARSVESIRFASSVDSSGFMKSVESIRFTMFMDSIRLARLCWLFDYSEILTCKSFCFHFADRLLAIPLKVLCIYCKVKYYS